MKNGKSKDLERVRELTRRAERARANGDERQARELDAQADQIAAKSSRAKVPYDPWMNYGAKIAQFPTARSRWQQARRSVKDDLAGVNVAVALAKMFEPMIVELTGSGATTTTIAFELASVAKAKFAAHHLAVRNEIAKQENLDVCADLVAEAGDVERAKSIAKTRNVRFAPIYETADAERGEVVPANVDQSNDERPNDIATNITVLSDGLEDSEDHAGGSGDVEVLHAT